MRSEYPTPHARLEVRVRVHDRGSDELQDREQATSRLIEECYRQGVVILKAGTYDNVIRFLPPLTVADGLLDEAFDVLEKALATVEAERIA